MPGTYRRLTGATRPGGPMRQKPALRSRIEPKTLPESKRGRQSHSTDPSGEISAPVWQSERNPYQEIRGKREIGMARSLFGRVARPGGYLPERA